MVKCKRDIGANKRRPSERKASQEELDRRTEAKEKSVHLLDSNFAISAHGDNGNMNFIPDAVER